uniref:Uncharacterized protein n=1 Tax=Nitzschia supralitorea TaxID=303403 RepID=A0A8F0WHR4_9STRA|nr:hypothetical protein KYU99_pgp067 [Nitzschia supralitorea]QWM93176.1 hypothetical protein [Nitzschia supralitorea]
MTNHSEIEDLLIASTFNDGVKIGKTIHQKLITEIIAGNLEIPSNQQPLNVEIELTDIFQYEIPLRSQILAKLGSPYVMGSRKYRFSCWWGCNSIKIWEKLFQSKK